MTPLEIPRTVYEAMVRHARAEAPLEACGIAAGRGGRVTRFFATENAEASPVRYAVPPQEILRIMQEIDREGEELTAIFHSHPATEAYPSVTDVRQACYPDACYLILSLAGPEPVLRGYRIRQGRVEDQSLSIF